MAKALVGIDLLGIWSLARPSVENILIAAAALLLHSLFLDCLYLTAAI